MRESGGILGPMGQDAWLRFRGRTVGAIVLAGFGAYSMYWWTLAAIPNRKTNLVLCDRRDQRNFLSLVNRAACHLPARAKG